MCISIKDAETFETLETVCSVNWIISKNRKKAPFSCYYRILFVFLQRNPKNYEI